MHHRSPPEIPLNALTLMILELNALQDSGAYDDITVQDVRERIDKGSVLLWLQERTGSVHLGNSYPGFEKWYLVYLQSIYDRDKSQQGQKWGARKKGLSLLIAWTNEIIREGKGWQANQDFVRRGDEYR